jgi:hypothetical protein
MAKRTKKATVAAVEPQIDEIGMMALEALAQEVETAKIEAEAIKELEALETAEPVEDKSISFDDMMATITSQDRTAAATALCKAVDERADFERTNGNENIQKTLKKARDKFSMPSTAAVLLACGVDEAFINRSVHDGKRYNVYAFDKLADTASALAGGLVNNRINFAIMRSMFAAKKAGVAFTGEVAKMAASDKIRIQDAAIKAILIRHTVSASTAPTQASSTMQALETLGIVKREGSHKNPTFTLTDHPAVAKLEAALAKAA